MAYASDESMFEYLNVVSKMFDSEAEGYEFYNKYALEKGFSVRRSYVEWDGSNKYIILRKIVCSRQGFREDKHMKRKMEDRKRRPRSLTRVGCNAKLVITRQEETGRWFVKDFIDEHSHPLAPRVFLVCCVRTDELAMSRKRTLRTWKNVGSANTVLWIFCAFNTVDLIRLDA